MKKSMNPVDVVLDSLIKDKVFRQQFEEDREAALEPHRSALSVSQRAALMALSVTVFLAIALPTVVRADGIY